MNDVTPRNTLMSANITWFAMVYTGITVGLSVLLQVLSAAQVAIPNGVTTGASIGAFMASAGIAGQRYAAKTNFSWTREDRAQLAMGYVIAALAVGLVLVIVFVTLASMLDPQTRAVIAEMAANQKGIGVLALFVAAGLIIFSVLAYVSARFMLGRLASAGPINKTK